MPFSEWIDRLGDEFQGRIYAYIIRVSRGGSRRVVKPVGEGVYEIKVDVGPGFRVYFGEVGRAIMLLLAGGDKSTQRKDIRQAIEYWRDYDETHKDV